MTTSLDIRWLVLIRDSWTPLFLTQKQAVVFTGDSMVSPSSMVNVVNVVQATIREQRALGIVKCVIDRSKALSR